MIFNNDIIKLAKALDLEISPENSDFACINNGGTWWLLYRGEIVTDEKELQFAPTIENTLPLTAIPKYLSNMMLNDLGIQIIELAIKQLRRNKNE